MSNLDTNLPVVVSSGGALTTTTGPQRIAARMAENLLSVALSQEQALAAQRRYRIGDYEFREADHAQIQRWARMLGMEPRKVLESLASSKKERWNNDIDADFRVTDGAIVSLAWDFALLPLTDWAWGQNLQIGRLGILNAPTESLPPLPECLYELICYGNQLTCLTLAQVPQLKILDCRNNQLAELDLTPVPGLQKLLCGDNCLTLLDLSSVPGLLELICYMNQLTYLDLTPVPGLQKLVFGDNKLTELDLTPVPGLQELDCIDNHLTVLDLTPVPGLLELICYMNQLTELDLTPVPKLKVLECDASVNIKNAPPNLKVNDR